MNAQNEDVLKSGDVQDVIMGMQIGCVAAELSRRLGITPSSALSLFYDSRTCSNLHDKRTGLYLFGTKYIADEFMMEEASPQ